MPLPVGLDAELQAAFVADEGLDAAMRSHVLVKQGLADVGLSKLERVRWLYNVSPMVPMCFLDAWGLK